MKKIDDSISPVGNSVKKITTAVLHQMKENGEKISMITAYDYSLMAEEQTHSHTVVYHAQALEGTRYLRPMRTEYLASKEA